MLVAARKPHKKKKSQVVNLPLAGFGENDQDKKHQPSNEGEEEGDSKPKRKTRIVSKTPRHKASDHFPDPSFDEPPRKTAGHESLYHKRRKNPESKLTFSSKVKQREEEAEEFDSPLKNPMIVQKKCLLQLNVRSNSNHEEEKASPHNSLLPRISHTPRAQGWDHQQLIYSPKVLTESGPYHEDSIETPRLKGNKSNTVRIQLPALSQDSTPRRLIALETPKKSKISNGNFGVEQQQEDQNQVRRPLILFTESSHKITEEDLHSFEKYSTPQNKRSLLLSQGFPSAFSNMGSDFVLKTQIERNRKDAEQLSLNSPQSARGVNWTAPGGVSSGLVSDHRNLRQVILYLSFVP